jgi:transcriptional regulator with XRE-family HTH domain
MKVASRRTRAAVGILGESIRAARLQRGWSVVALAERVGVSAPTITKVERGDPSVAIGTVFEAAHLVGVELYGGNQELAGQVVRNQLALLPQRGRTKRKADNDF